MAGDHTIAVVLLLLHAELVASVGLQHVVLSEGALIEQQGNALAGSQLTTLVLGLNALLATTEQSRGSGLLQTLSESSLDRDNGGLDLLLRRELSGHDHFSGRTAVTTHQVSQHCKAKTNLRSKYCDKDALLLEEPYQGGFMVESCTHPSLLGIVRTQKSA